jgi:hypothetical protein
MTRACSSLWRVSGLILRFQHCTMSSAASSERSCSDSVGSLQCFGYRRNVSLIRTRRVVGHQNFKHL